MIRSVAVLGGGPAGSMAAERLAAAGLRTVLIDEKLAWEKPCGGGVTWKAARALGVDLTPLAERTISTVDLHWRLKAATTMPVVGPVPNKTS